MSYDFDAWRERYDSMTYQDHLDVYSELFELYPVQRHFDAEAVEHFLARTIALKVIEIGGWNGELATLMLSRVPYIESWTNVEICLEAIVSRICTDPRFSSVATSTVAVTTPMAACEPTNLVMSHSAEHMRWNELQATLAAFNEAATGIGPAIYLASPLPEDGSAPDWNHYPGTHILEVGWDTIGAFLGGLGFRQMVAPRTHEVRAWAKI